MTIRASDDFPDLTVIAASLDSQDEESAGINFKGQVYYRLPE
jgi:hypothetical protein